MSKDKITKYVTIFILGVGLFLLYYLNNTYVINFFDGAFPLLIKRFKSREIYLLDRPDQVSMVGAVRLWSVVFYFIAINLFHILLINKISGRKAALVFIFIALSVSVFYGVFFLLFKFFPESANLYYLSRVLKDFVLSPVLLVVYLILYRFFHPTSKFS